MRTHEWRSRSQGFRSPPTHKEREGAAAGLLYGEEAGGRILLGNEEAWLSAPSQNLFNQRDRESTKWTGTALALVLLRD
jgi:hypothetical protein